MKPIKSCVSKVMPVVSGICLFAGAASPAQAQWNPTDAMMSNNSYSSGWVNPYNNTMSNIYQSNMNMITQHAIQNSQMFNRVMINGRWSRTSSKRANRIKQMQARERAEAARFEKYKGTMYKDAGTSPVPAKLAATFSKGIGQPQKAADMEKVFKALLDVYKQRARQQGAPPNDMARTLAYCITANYIIFAGKEGVHEKQIAPLRAKIRTALSEDTKFRSLSDAKKREVSDTMIIMAHLVAWGAEDLSKKLPKENQADVRAGYRKLAGVNLKGLLGVAPESVAFDDDGLIIKS